MTVRWLLQSFVMIVLATLAAAQPAVTFPILMTNAKPLTVFDMSLPDARLGHKDARLGHKSVATEAAIRRLIF